MSDTKSIKSQETKHGFHTLKKCAECGKEEGKHWRRHWNEKHPGKEILELQ